MARISRRVAAALVVGTLAVASQSAAAQDVPLANSGESAADEEARQEFEAGRQAYEHGRFAKAADHFQRAYQLSARTQLLFNVARAADSDGQYERAVQAYTRYIELMQDAENREFAVARLQRLRELQSAALEEPASARAHKTPVKEPRSTPPVTKAHSADPAAAAIDGSLQIESDEPGTLAIDGSKYGALPQLVRHLTPGPHRVEVSFLNGESSTRVVMIHGGQQAVVRLEGKRSPQASEPQERPHFGLGVEAGFGHNKYTVATLRAVVRLNYAVSPHSEVLADVVVGAFPSVVEGRSGYEDKELASFGVELRGELLVRLGSIFMLGIGVDLGVVTDGAPFTGGAHVPIGVRFGEAREYRLSLASGARLTGGGHVFFEQTLCFAYLFL